MKKKEEEKEKKTSKRLLPKTMVNLPKSFDLGRFPRQEGPGRHGRRLEGRAFRRPNEVRSGVRNSSAGFKTYLES